MSPEGDTLSPEGVSEVISWSPGEIKPNFTDLSTSNILPSPMEPNHRRSSQASNAPSCFIESCNNQSTLDMFHSTPKPTGRIVEAMYLNDKTVNPVDVLCTKFLPLDEFGCPADG